ncbi:NAD(P)/FAD-dependent oxidoreductase [Mycobacterium sp. 236(2023)]|uniref:NAD(P)/FAD-dependent oxidoreductase n=1 Tax=Mycobacterium sp. 236(2023) TaxID=3038163 RepID=UPI0024152D34|nr:NAD(P)/FAD-dependent oxidoreductase [Mycobacterium sp. 236(2023)]MDG4663447.1 NAD(P)/FAD-dependent oxidoreductase [Mycobacterium sp. 236(2023)]
MQVFDVVIVGARCAGSPLATLLARRGLSVCVLDKVQFPSETPSTHIIQPRGAASLERIGALDAVRAAGAATIDSFTMVNDDVRIEDEFDRSIFPQPGLCVRRVTLDSVLVDTATAAGADVRTGVKVTGLMRTGGRVTGVETAHGPIGAQLVVGADGRHSTVAKDTGAQEYSKTPMGRVPVWGYFEGVDNLEGRIRIARIGENAYLASPTDGGLYMVCVAMGADCDTRRNEAFDAGIAGWPELADLLAGARRTGPLRVMAKWHGYFRQAAGPGWVLVGDAGHFKDFTPGQGISDALCQAERLTDLLPAELADAAAVDAATERWWRWRDRDAYAMHWFATDLGAPGAPTPVITEVLRDIAGDPAARRTLMRVLNHEAAPKRLLTPRRLAVATGRALRRPRQRFATGAEIAGAVRNEIRRTRSVQRFATLATPGLRGVP